MTEISRYAERGVSSDKSEVHKAIKNLHKGLYPNAFCKILPDWVGNEEEYCNIIHADTAGTKPTLAYMYWKETGDVSVWKGIAQDAIVMNLDDMACVGATTDFILSSTIGRNKHLVTGDVIEAIISGTVEFIETMADYGVSINHGGGETADVGDVVRTADVGYTLFKRMKRSDLIVNDIKPGQTIVGLAGYGQAEWENKENSSIASNGLTSARHDVLSKHYAQTYPETYAAGTDDSLVYCGKYLLQDKYLSDGSEYQVSDLLLSPTRTFAPLLKEMFASHKQNIKGVIHNTGGAHSKVTKFLNGAKVIKNNLLPVPPVFSMIRECSGAGDHEMYQVFNMGTRIELYVDGDQTAQALIDLSKSVGIDAQVIGHTESSSEQEVHLTTREGNQVIYKNS